jgi:hypothetical protein
MAFPFAKRYGPSAPADLEFLDDDTTNAVPNPIGLFHKCLLVGTPPSASNTTSAPAGPSPTVPRAPLEPQEDADGPSTFALYVPPTLRASGTPIAPRAAMAPPSA